MDRRFTIGWALVMAIAFWVAGCGGGVTTTPAATNNGQTQPVTSIALSTAGSLASGTAIGGIGVTVSLPESVSVKVDERGNVDAGVVATSGVAAGQATVITLYESPTTTAPAKLHIVLASSTSGMTVGEFVKVTCTVTSATDPLVSEFVLSDFAPVDLYGAAIPQLTANIRSVTP
jgi:hypothetical protein